MAKYDRTAEDLGNIVCLEHVNTRVPDQQLAVTYYLMGLGCTRDPYLMAGTTNMWINIGRQQFHLPTHAEAQVLNGHSGLVMPDRAALLERLDGVKDALAGTQFAVAEHNDYVETTCPWGNKMRVYEPGERFGPMQLGMPYVEVNTPQGTADGVVRFYNEIICTSAWTSENDGAACANVSVGDGQTLVYRETADAIPDPAGLHLVTRLNGEVVQDTTTDLMIASVQRLIAYCSTILPLLPGDVIVSGTPGGVGAKRTPPLWMKDGDVCEVEISGIGVLRNPVRAEA